MVESSAGLFHSDAFINIISCAFTVLALVFALYLWLLDHLIEDEAKYIAHRAKMLAALRESLAEINGSVSSETLLKAIQRVNVHLETALNYRFWTRSKQREEYNKINVFYRDSLYLVSTLRRSLESETIPGEHKSLLSISSLEAEQLEDIRSDYYDGLTFIIEFIENWN